MTEIHLLTYVVHLLTCVETMEEQDIAALVQVDGKRKQQDTAVLVQVEWKLKQETSIIHFRL